MTQIFSILVQNKAGVLSKVSNLFARRGYNIDSLAVGETQNSDISRITIAIQVGTETIAQIIRQLYKLPDVIMVRHLQSGEHFSRQLVFIKVHATQADRSGVLQVAEIFRGHIVDVSAETVTLEISGSDDKIAACRKILEPFGIIELVRTGKIAIERGEANMDPSGADAQV